MGALTDKVAMVTGASRGIGAAIAAALAAEGAAVVVSARTEQEGDNKFLEGSLATTVQAIEAAGGEASAIPGNLATEDGCRAIAEAAIDRYGRVDVLVNNAAVAFFGDLVDLKFSRWNVSWQVTVSAPVLLSQLVLPGMIERGEGRIVNLSSESAIGPGRGPYPAEQPIVGDTAYGAQKAAIERLTQGLAQEVYAKGIGVAALAPSLIVPTPGALFNNAIDGFDDPRAEDPAHMAKAATLLATLPLDEMSGRMVYSQQLLAERGLLDRPAGLGVNSRWVTGYASAAAGGL
jgi:NAD(P)-dependent dehydrogenase (short-subunit alcohol dehydrogenase family)